MASVRNFFSSYFVIASRQWKWCKCYFNAQCHVGYLFDLLFFYIQFVFFCFLFSSGMSGDVLFGHDPSPWSRFLLR